MSTLKERLQEKINNGTLYPSDFSNLSELLKEGSYLFYELEDCTKEIPLEINVGEGSHGSYTREISPLFYERVINNRANWELIDIITEEIPFYYMEPDVVYSEDDIFLQSTRDIGINNVPAPLQESDFYETWFRDAFGYVQNLTLLDIYNKLRYPYIMENQYLNARIFHRMADEAFVLSDDPESRIGFKDSEEENSEVYNEDYEFYGEEIGCLDYMQDIVSQKVDSNYALIDFNPEQSSFLSNWIESLYQSGQISKSESKEERLLFKLQDIKSELLRRKFSGSYSLYMLMLASIGRMGSYIGVIAAGDAKVENTGYYDENGNITGYAKSFNDERPIRVPYLPGLTTAYSDAFEKEVLNPIDVYYFKPTEDKKIPLGTLIPLFYSSAPEVYYNGSWNEKWKWGTTKLYTEAFMQAIDPSMEDSPYVIYTNPNKVTESLTTERSSSVYRSIFYRENVNVIPWDNISGVLSQESLIEYYETLDMLIYDETTGRYRYRTLDEKYDNDTYKTLDVSGSSADLSSVYGSVLDITANRLLYHRNILQRGDNDYEFLTYPIADDNGVCLMDTSWLDYVEYHSSKKSKVNESITFGAQVSTFLEVEDNLTVPVEFFAYETALLDESTGNISVCNDLDECNVVNLYYCTLRYDASKFKIKAFSESTDVENNNHIIEVIEKTLISSIRLRHDADPSWKDNDGSLKSEYKDFEKFTKYNVGVLPITYKAVVDDYVRGLKIGKYGEDFYDDPLTQGISDAYFVFSEMDTTRDCSYKNIEPCYDGNNSIITYKVDDDSSPVETIFRGRPTENTKEVYFIIKKMTKYDKDNTTGKDVFSWSDPIRVLPLSFITSIQKDSEFKPDWFGLVYHLNPYLNFTEESASALRHKSCIKDYKTTDSSDKYTEGPSHFTGLSNLVRTRRMDFVCNDSGNNSDPWLRNDIKGLYLSHIQGDRELGEPDVSSLLTDDVYPAVLIYGDNRYSDRFGMQTETIEEVTLSDLSNNKKTFDDKDVIYYFSDDLPDGWTKGYYVFDSLVTDKVPKWRRIYNLDTLRDFSHIYEDDSSMFKSIHIERTEIPDGADSSKLRQNYFKITPGILATSYDNWYWNNKEGMTICLNVIFDFDDSFDSTMILAEREGEFTLKMCYYGSGTEDETDNSGVKIVFTSNGVSLTSDAVIESGKNYRISATIGANGSALFVNEYVNTGSGVSTYSSGTENAPIILFCSIDGANQTDCFYGDILDLRLYNEEKSVDNLRILNMGLFREIYSYGPSSYKIGHSVYRDLGIIRVVDNTADNPTDYGIKHIGSIRIFDRSVWDSIMTDLYPVSTMEADIESPQYYEHYKNPKDDTDIYDSRGQLNHCIEQTLVNKLELFNGYKVEQDTTLVYNSKYYRLLENSYITAVMALIQPVDYSDSPIDVSGVEFNVNNQGYISSLTGEPIMVPLQSDSSDDYFKFSADLYPIFSMPCSTSLSRFISRGTNITLSYNSEADDSLIVLKNNTIKQSDKNYVLIPLVFPEIESGTEGTIDRFRIRNFSLGEDFSRMLRANSYYTEVLIPNPIIETVEGYSELDSASYAIGHLISEWASVFKKDVYKKVNDEYVKITSETEWFDSEETYYVWESTDIKKYRYEWSSLNLLKPGAYHFTCKYPLKILPFSDDEFYNISKKNQLNTLYGTFKFKIVVSIENNESDVIEVVDIPESKRYPKAEGTLKSASDRLSPEDNKTFNKKKVSINLYALDCNGVAGKMNGIVEDYDFTWKLIASNDPSYAENDSVVYLNQETLDNGVLIKEDVSMFLMKNYVEPFFISKYYKGKGEQSIEEGTEDDDIICPIRLIPYSRENEEKLVVESEDDLDSLALISGRSYRLLFDYTSLLTEFRFEDNPSNFNNPGKSLDNAANILDSIIQDSHSKYIYSFDDNYSSYKYDSSTKIRAYDNSYVERALDIYEKTLLSLHYESIDPKEITVSVKGSSCGIIGGFSIISPGLSIGSGSISITNDRYNLYSYQTPAWEIPIKNNFYIFRRSTSGTNLISNTDLSDTSVWERTFTDGIYSSILRKSSYDENGTEYPSIKVLSNGSISFKYLGGSGTEINSVYYLRFKIRFIPDNVSVTYKLYNAEGETVESGDMEPHYTSSSAAEQDIEFSVITQNPIKVSSVEFCVSLSPVYEPSTEYPYLMVLRDTTAYFKDCVVSVYSASKYLLGLSDVYYNNASSDDCLVIPGHNLPVFMNNDTSEYLPIQFKNGIIDAGGAKRPNASLNRMATFLNNCVIGEPRENSRIRDIVPPWIRRMYIYHRPNSESATSADGFDTEIEFHKYSTKKDAYGIASNKEVFSNINDIYSVSDNVNDFINTQYDEDKEGFVITISSDSENEKGMRMLLDSEGSLLSTGCVLNVQGVELSDGKYSFTYNCFDLTRYRQRVSNPVGITNIQLMNRTLIEAGGSYDNREVIYEIEYLPIIYDELKNHISFNILLHHSSVASSLEETTPGGGS